MKKIILCFVSVLTAFSLIISVNALIYFKGGAEDLNDGLFSPRLTCDPDEITVYITNSSNYSSYVAGAREAISSWDYTSGAWEIELTETSSYATCTCNILTYNRDSSTYQAWKDSWGFTQLYFGDGPYSGNNVGYTELDNLPDNEDYWGGEIYINYKALNADAVSPINMNKSVVAHELGHMLGLYHYSTNGSIMRESFKKNDEDVHTPTLADKNNVIFLYSYR